MPTTSTTTRARTPKADQACLDAVDLAREAALETAGVVGTLAVVEGAVVQEGDLIAEIT